MMTLEEAIKHCEEKGRGCTECAAEHRQLSNWLKELKNLRRKQPQSQWKPSDEQLDSLYDVLNPCDGLSREVLESLYQDLKKLREE